jgi:hypothetical protein
MKTPILILFAVTVVSAITKGVDINFDDISPSPAPIGDHYLSLGVRFFQGNDQFGQSTNLLISGGNPVSAWVYPGVYASPPNVMVPQPAGNNDIWVYFYDTAGNRTVVDSVGVHNDNEADPNCIVFEAYGPCGTLLAKTNICGSGIGATITAPASIYYARIYSAPGDPGLLGVDDFNFSPSLAVSNGLQIVQASNSIIMSWSGSLTNYVIESSSMLSGGWTASTNVPILISNKYYLTNSVSEPAQFYRLRYRCQ